MYVHPAFKIHHAVGLAFAAARGFGHVIACEGGRPVAALLPFHVMEANGRLPRLQFHVARPNPIAHLATKGGPWLVAVAGDDAYVSPHWYASAEQVPTWLYETVQLRGPVHVVPTSHTADHLDHLVAQFESALAPKPPWVADIMLSSQRRATLMESIVVIEMTVETWRAASNSINTRATPIMSPLSVRCASGAGRPPRRLRRGWSRCGRTWRTNRQPTGRT